MKSIKSFEVLLLAILLVIALAQLQDGLDWGNPFYFLLASMCLLVIRRVIGARTIREAHSWMRSHVRIAIYLLLIVVANAVYVGSSFMDGYVDLIEAIGAYFFVITLFSAVVLLGEYLFQFVLNLFRRKK